jgi:hypothetical protein
LKDKAFSTFLDQKSPLSYAGKWSFASGKSLFRQLKRAAFFSGHVALNGRTDERQANDQHDRDEHSDIAGSRRHRR